MTSDDPNARRRRDPEAKHQQDRQILKLKKKGLSVRAIAERLGLHPTSVQRVLKTPVKPVPPPDVDFDDDELSEDDVVLSRMSPLELLRWDWDQNARALEEDPTNPLELFRRGYLPVERPSL